MFRKILLISLLFVPVSVSADGVLSEWWNAPKYSWVAGGYSQSVQTPGERGLTITGGQFPKETGFGYLGFLEGTKLDDPDDDGMVYTLGAEGVFKWKWVYVGLGMSVSDRTTAVSGTLWNFRERLGLRYKPAGQDWFVDGSIAHSSHCARCGIEEDKVNTGMTSVILQLGLTF